MTTIRPFLWLILGFGIVPFFGVVLAFLTMTNAHPVGIPVAGIATGFLYIFAADLGWTLFGRSYPAGAIAAFGAVVLVGYGIPAAVNATIGDTSHKLASADATPITIGTPDIFAILTPYQQTRDKTQVETDCEILCQRLLYYGNRKAVLMGATPPSGSPIDTVGLIRYSIEHRSNCPSIKVPQATVMPGQMQYGNSNATSETVESRIGMGDCLIAQPGVISEADVVTIKSKPDSSSWIHAGNSAGPIAIWRSDVYRRTPSGWRQVGQATERRFSKAISPMRLRFIGPFPFPGALVSQENGAPPQDPYMIEHLLAPWLAWPQGMPDGSQGPPKPLPLTPR